jgi:phosphoglycerate dehydrogenase-like enzyme
VLNQAGRKIVKADLTQKMSEEQLIESPQGVDGAIIGVVPMTAYVMEHTPSLKVVSMHGVGVAKRALGIEMRLLACDPYVQAENMEEGVSIENELWYKGATSGTNQPTVEVCLDCDADRLLIRVHPAGSACLILVVWAAQTS